MVVRHVPEPGSQQLLLEKDDVDIALNLQPDQLKRDARLKNRKVRLALKYLVDYHGMTQETE